MSVDQVDGEEVVMLNTSFLSKNTRRKHDGKTVKQVKTAEAVETKPLATPKKELRPLRISKNQDKLPQVHTVIKPILPTHSVKLKSSTVYACGREPGRERQIAHNAVFLA